MQRQQSTAERTFRLIDVQQDIEETLRNAEVLRPPQHEDYAPLAVRAPTVPMPTYVEHRDGVSQVGKLTAEAVVREYEAAAKEIDAMGTELKSRVEKLEAMKAEAVVVMDEIKETAARYRDEGKRIFLQIEDCALMTDEVRRACNDLKAKIAGPVS